MYDTWVLRYRISSIKPRTRKCAFLNKSGRSYSKIFGTHKAIVSKERWCSVWALWPRNRTILYSISSNCTKRTHRLLENLQWRANARIVWVKETFLLGCNQQLLFHVMKRKTRAFSSPPIFTTTNFLNYYCCLELDEKEAGRELREYLRNSCDLKK